MDLTPTAFGLREAINIGRRGTAALDGQPSQEGCLDAPTFINIDTVGNECVIQIPQRTVLFKIMERVGSKAPIFTCTTCGGSQWRVCIELDVPGSTLSCSKPPSVTKVEGEICDSPAEAEASAIVCALNYLCQVHSIEVRDYSSSIIEMFLTLGHGWGDVDDLVILLNNLIEQWDLSLAKCEKLSRHLEYNVIVDDNCVGVSEASQIYTSLDEFIIYIIKRYENIPVFARLELQKIQHVCEDSGVVSTKRQDIGRQTVSIPVKDMLDYVLSDLGIEKAKYKSVKNENGDMEGEVKFSFPFMLKGKCHILEVHSQAIHTSEPVEVAARAALLFMESKFNVTVADMNYDDRQKAEKDHKSVELAIYSLLGMARETMTQLGNMVECIAGGSAAYGGDARLLFGGPLCQEQLMALDFCSKKIEGVRADCAAYADIAASILQGMENKCYML